MTTVSPETMTVAVQAETSLWRRCVALQRKFPILQLVIVIVTWLVGAATLPGFASIDSIKAVLILASLVGFAALGQTIVVLLGGIDLSVANFLVVGALMVTQVAQQLGLDFWAALLLVFPVSLILGGIVGWICHRFSINPLIVTMAMGAIAIGLLQAQTAGILVGGAPEWLMTLTSPRSTTFGLPVPPVLVIWALVIIVMMVVIHRTPVGRRLQAAGANPVAAEYSLIRMRRTWVIVFALSALLASLAGVMLAAFAGNVSTSVGGPYLFQSLTAVIIGGTVLGGPGDYTRTVIGAVLLVTLTTVLIGHGFATSDQQILYGIIIIGAMVLYGREKKLSDRV